MEHEWNVTPAEAISIQKELQEKVLIKPLSKPIKVIAGVDVSLNMFEKDIYAGIILFSFPDLEVLEYALVKSKTSFPYISGLLSFREIPALLECYKKLTIKPDLIVVDGQGIAHPRRFGIASHLGVLLNVPTIGCAKSKLYGTYKEPKKVFGESEIVNPKTEEVIGVAFKSKKNSNPLIVSPGHLVTVHESIKIIKETLHGYKLPEPTRQAHLLVNKFRKREVK